jgi:hypothetical protein
MRSTVLIVAMAAASVAFTTTILKDHVADAIASFHPVAQPAEESLAISESLKNYATPIEDILQEVAARGGCVQAHNGETCSSCHAETAVISRREFLRMAAAEQAAEQTSVPNVARQAATTLSEMIFGGAGNFASLGAVVSSSGGRTQSFRTTAAGSAAQIRYELSRTFSANRVRQPDFMQDLTRAMNASRRANENYSRTLRNQTTFAR